MAAVLGWAVIDPSEETGRAGRAEGLDMGMTWLRTVG